MIQGSAPLEKFLLGQKQFCVTILTSMYLCNGPCNGPVCVWEYNCGCAGFV